MPHPVHTLLDCLGELSQPSKWRIHGNGFLQIPLPDNYRLHVWDSRWFNPLPDHNAQVHDHVWDFESEILAGDMFWSEWVMVEPSTVSSTNPDGEAKYSIWSVGIAGQPGMGDCLAKNMLLKQRIWYSKQAGDKYTFTHGRFHSVSPDNRCVTLMRKIPVAGNEASRPRVICPNDEEPQDAFAFTQPEYTNLASMLEGSLTTSGYTQTDWFRINMRLTELYRNLP